MSAIIELKPISEQEKRYAEIISKQHALIEKMVYGVYRAYWKNQSINDLAPIVVKEYKMQMNDIRKIWAKDPDDPIDLKLELDMKMLDEKFNDILESSF